MTFPWIYKQGTDGLVSQWTVEVIDNKFRSHSGVVNGVITINDWTTCESKNVGKTNETTGASQALKEAQALYQKKINKGYNTDIAKANVKKYFEPMLAQKYEDRKKEITYPIYSQPKLDGVRCVIDRNGMWTRTGKPILSVPHIFEEVKFLFTIWPDLVLDGELYCDKYNNDFNQIISLVRKTKPTAEDLIESKVIEYWIYDCSHNNSEDDALDILNQGFVFRSAFLLDKVFTKIWEAEGTTSNEASKCVYVPTFTLMSEQQIEEKFEEYIDQGFEGQMLRACHGLYENKRSKNLLKHKTWQDGEWTILGVEEGKGIREGTIGKFLFVTSDGKEFKSNLKFNHATLADMWLKKDTYIGKQATIKYFNFTPDGKPRFAYVIAIRDYE
jgi:DNA ligase-1